MRTRLGTRRRSEPSTISVSTIDIDLVNWSIFQSIQLGFSDGSLNLTQKSLIMASISPESIFIGHCHYDIPFCLVNPFCHEISAYEWHQ
jgi:hypothetical protein